MTDDLLPEKLSPAAKRQRRRYIAEAKTAIEKGDKAYAELGQALWALQDEGLYSEDGLTFPEFVLAEFGISKSNAYRCIEIAKYVTAHPLEPIPSQYAIEAARPKRPKVGTGGDRHVASDQPVPAVIDAEGWEEPEPKALPEAQKAVLGGMSLGVPEIEDALSADHDDRCESEADPIPEAVAETMWWDGEDSRIAVDAGIINDAAWNSANVVKPAEMTQAEYDTWTTKLHDDAKARIVAEPGFLTIRESNGTPITSVLALINYLHIGPTEALIDLLSSADLDAVGRELTADQMDTLTKAYEQIRESWTVTHKARKDWSKELRARRPAESTGRPPVAPRSGGSLDRREVEPRFKQGKAKVAR